MQYGIVRLGGSKWHILKLQGDSLENVASGGLASAIAFDDYEAAKTYVGVLQAEDLALAEKAAPPAEAETPAPDEETPAPVEPAGDPAPAIEDPPVAEAPPAAEKQAPAPAGNPAPIPLAGDPAPAIEAAGRGPGILDRLKGTLRALGIMPRTEAERTALAVKALFAGVAEGALGGIKALGDGLWIGAFTNNFEDRDGEIITTAALDGMIQRLNAGLIPMPELWYKHKSYTKHGKAIFIARAGHIVYAVGRFDKSLLGAMMEKYYKANPGFAMSHGFTFPPWGYDEETKQYTVINTFEISALPPEMAANLYTPFKTIGEDSEMGKLTEDQVKELERELGPQIAAVVVANHKQLEGAGDKIEKILGPAFKDFTSVPTPAAPAPAPVQTVSTEPAAAPVETPAADSEAEDKAPDMAAVGQLLSDLMDSVVASNEAIMFLAEQNNAQQAFNTAVAEALGVAAVPASEAPETALPAEGMAEAGKAKEALAKKSPGKENPYAEIPQLEGLYTE